MAANYIREENINGITLWKVKHDINGNPRYVFHFLALINDAEIETLSILQQYDLAVRRARSFGGRKYTAKWFGGGIVVTSYNVSELPRYIEDAKKCFTL